jgi:hypothetical protein
MNQYYKYGIEYKHGSTVVFGDVTIHRFATKQERNDWVADGSEYVGPGEREMLSANHKLVQRSKHMNEEGIEYPMRMVA